MEYFRYLSSLKSILNYFCYNWAMNSEEVLGKQFEKTTWGFKTL